MELNQPAQAPQSNFGMPTQPNTGMQFPQSSANQNIPNFNIPSQNLGPVVFDQNELSEMNNIREVYDQLTIALGQVEMQKREINKNEKRTLERLTAIEAQEKVFLDKIVAKYGEGTFDVNTGIFTPKR